MAQTADCTSAGWRLRPGSECTGNKFSKLVITHCGGKAFLVNDPDCDHNTICDGQFSDNTQGGLSQAKANLVTMQTLEKRAQPVLPASVAFIK